MTNQHDDFDQQQARQADVVNPYDQPPINPHDPPPPKSWVPACLIGCGVVALIVALLCGIGGYLTVKKGPGLIAKTVRDGLAEEVRSSDLPKRSLSTTNTRRIKPRKTWNGMSHPLSVAI